MRFQLDKPELERFIVAEVKAGHFPSADAAIAAAVEQMMLDRGAVEIDEETVAAIAEGEAQLDRGEGIELDEAFAELRKKHVCWNLKNASEY